jgi:RNA polymerase sigma factor (sigma-70 family)
MSLVLENDLIESAKLGGEALERLITVVWPEAYRISLGILRDVGLAEDAAQEACASIARALPTLKSTDLFRTWSYRIIANRAMTLARRRPYTEPLDAVLEQRFQNDRTEALDLYNALATLPYVQRAAIILRYYADLNSSEIAAAVALPASTVRFHLMLARRTLRKALSMGSARPSKEILSDA